MLLPPNTLLQNRYLIKRQVGQGGMGAVYEARHQQLGHAVALKQTIVSGPQLQQAFEREARILARLRHSALPNVIDYFSERNSQFLVMEYIPGDDLATLLHRQRAPFALAQVLAWADQLLDALEYLHSHQPPIIHRDIKPANIKLSPGGGKGAGQIILLDFGLAKGGQTNSGMTISGASVFGFTPHYAPLEQINGSGTDERSDLYALAATLYHLLTATQLPSATTRAGALLSQSPDPLPPANQLNPQIPAPIAALLSQAMHMNPAQRPSNAQAMRQALQQATRSASPRTEILPPTVPEPPQTPPPNVRRHRNHVPVQKLSLPSETPAQKPPRPPRQEAKRSAPVQRNEKIKNNKIKKKDGIILGLIKAFFILFSMLCFLILILRIFIP